MAVGCTIQLFRCLLCILEPRHSGWFDLTWWERARWKHVEDRKKLQLFQSANLACGLTHWSAYVPSFWASSKISMECVKYVSGELHLYSRNPTNERIKSIFPQPVFESFWPRWISVYLCAHRRFSLFWSVSMLVKGIFLPSLDSVAQWQLSYNRVYNVFNVFCGCYCMQC